MQIKTYNMRTETEPEKPHFFVLNKGTNSGRPNFYPYANCFVIITDSNEECKRCYWLIYALWQGKCFHQILRGSVIEFVTIHDFAKVVKDCENKVNKNRVLFHKSIEMLQNVDKHVGGLKHSLKLSEQLKQAIVFRLLNT